jgi:hypothetical protein
MNLVAIGFCFLVAFSLTLARGAGTGFVYAYLPALILLSTVTGVPILGLPDPTPPTAAIYGILAGAILRGRAARLRLLSVDKLFLGLLLAYVVSAVSTEFVYTGVSIFGSLLLQLVAPYFIARISLEQRSLQREALVVLAACSVIVAVFAVIEFRLWPNTYAWLLAQTGLGVRYVDFAFSRFGFFRASSSFWHPIDLGNSAALLGALVAILGLRTGLGLRPTWLRLALAAAFVSWLTAGSFTSFIGLGSGAALFLLLRALPRTRRHLAAGVLAVIAAGFSYAAVLANAPLPDMSEVEGTFAMSFWVRQLILHEAWAQASSAGLFGWGRLVQVGSLESIDNAYLVIAIQRGWLALALWLAIPVALASLVSRALRRARSDVEASALLLGFCAAFGTMLAMFTVWLGFAYQSLFVIVLALSVSTAQATLRAAAGRARAQAAALPAVARTA